MRKKVLFLSSANGARSQMAEAFLRAFANDGFEAYSAGSTPHGIHPLAVEVMAEREIDIRGQQTDGLEDFIGTATFDFLITVCDRDEKGCPMYPGKGTREYWPLTDPGRTEGSDAERLAAFRDARDHIEARVRRWLVERRYKPAPPPAPVDTGADR